MSYLSNIAESALELGKSYADIELMLIDEGLSPQAASQIVAERQGRILGQSRSFGFWRVIIGGSMMIAGLAIAFGPNLAGASGVIFIGAGVVVSTFGLSLFGLGFKNLRDGHE